jgi:hypothetical protein
MGDERRLSIEKAYQRYADALSRRVEPLTPDEKRAAFMDYILARLGEFGESNTKSREIAAALAGFSNPAEASRDT